MSVPADTAVPVPEADRAAVETARRELLARAHRMAAPAHTAAPVRARAAQERLAAHGPAVGHLLDLLDLPATESPGPLSGVPFVVKDLFDLRGRTTRSGSPAHRDRPPAARSAEAVERLVAAGAIPVATVAMDELAHGFTGINDHHGVCRNPHDLGRIAGGSSSGSAAAVALGDVPLALGSDTNGSVRVPASLCGVYGVKPGHGRIPTRGMAPFAASLDHVGFLAASARLCRLVLDVLVPGEHAEPDRGRADLARLSPSDAAALAGPEARATLDAAVDALGVRNVVGLPWLERAMEVATVITAAEGAEQHLPILLDRRAELGASARVGLTAGALLPATALVAAQRERSELRSAATATFRGTDVLLLPCTPGPAPAIEQDEIRLGDGRAVGREPYLGIFTAAFSLLGLPAVSVPVRSPGSPPVGVQLVGRPGSERLLLAVAAELEHVVGLTQPPAVAA